MTFVSPERERERERMNSSTEVVVGSEMLATAAATAIVLAISLYVLFVVVRRSRDQKYLERHSEWAKEDVKAKQRELDIELVRSVLRDDVAKVKSNLKLGADPMAFRFDNKDTLLHVAKKIGNNDLNDALLRRMNTKQIAEKNANGDTANDVLKETDFAEQFLMKNSNHKVMDKKTAELLSKNIKPLNVVDKNTGNTVLHAVAESGNLQSVRELVRRAKETRNEKDFMLSSVLNTRKETVLHCAVRNKNPDVVREILTLCEKDKYITAVQDVNGDTVLHTAATSPEIFDILITRVPPGAANVRNSKNLTAKELNISLDPTMDVDTFE